MEKVLSCPPHTIYLFLVCATGCNTYNSLAIKFVTDFVLPAKTISALGN